MFDITRLNDDDPTDTNIGTLVDSLHDAINEIIEDNPRADFSVADLVYALATILLDGPDGKSDPYWDMYALASVMDVMTNNRLQTEEITLQ